MLILLMMNARVTVAGPATVVAGARVYVAPFTFFAYRFTAGASG
jgi:hypothetical protein